MDIKYNTWEGKYKHHQNFDHKKRKRNDYFWDLGIEGRIILKRILGYKMQNCELGLERPMSNGVNTAITGFKMSEDYTTDRVTTNF